MSDDIAFLLRETRKYPLLSSEETISLGVRIKTGDKKARDLLVLHNMRLVASTSKRFQNHGVSLNDLIQEGMIGLIKAAEQFDCTKNNKFSTYAVWWIRAYIIRLLHYSSSCVKRTVTSGKFAEDLSLNAPVMLSSGVDTPTYEDRLVCDKPTGEDQCIKYRHRLGISTTLENIKKKLSALEWDVITMRLMEDPACTLQDLGDKYACSREWVRLVETKMRKLLAKILVVHTEDPV